MTNLSRQKHSSKNLIAKVKNLSLGTRAILFVFSMGSIGAAIGLIDNKITFNQCLKSEVCLTSDVAEEKIHRIGIGAVAGMIAASMLSLPSILDEN